MRHILYGNGIGEKQMTDTHISERYEFRNIKQNEAEEAAEIENYMRQLDKVYSYS